MDVTKPFELLIQIIDRNFPSPTKEILIGAFCVTLLFGLIYGMTGGFIRRPPPPTPPPPAPPGDEEVEVRASPTAKKLQAELDGSRKLVRTLQTNQRVEFIERYYLYFNGIANASLMLAFAILLDRYHQATPPFGTKQAEIGKLMTLILVSLLVSITFNVLFDLLAPRPDRRTDLINRAFLISFVANLMIFLAYHYRYINL